MKFYGKIILLLIVNLLAVNTFSQPCSNPTTSNCADAIAGTSKFLMSTPGNVNFTFDDMQKYVSGITNSGSTQLRLKVDEIIAGNCKWKLMMYIDNNGYLPTNEWEQVITPYGLSGNNPELNLIQVKVYNGCGTPLSSGIFQTFTNNVNYDILDIIPDLLGVRNMPGSCDGTNINGPGSYLTNYNEYNFNIDYRILPGYALKSGVYQIKINFCLVEVP
jgi:hypothetical protein